MTSKFMGIFLTFTFVTCLVEQNLSADCGTTSVSGAVKCNCCIHGPDSDPYVLGTYYATDTHQCQEEACRSCEGNLSSDAVCVVASESCLSVSARK